MWSLYRTYNETYHRNLHDPAKQWVVPEDCDPANQRQAYARRHSPAAFATREEGGRITNGSDGDAVTGERAQWRCRGPASCGERRGAKACGWGLPDWLAMRGAPRILGVVCVERRFGRP
ncbi:hypothetical protein HDU96_007898 [Phlyctochytrium bullatum]|nr:hypothetical protein HDU96_007898 [Phlyctochytrium bullatum]